MSGALALATRIAGMSREQLIQLVSERRIAQPDLVTDPVDLAQALLRTDSLQEAVRALDRDAVCALTAQASGRPRSADPAQLERLGALGLIGLSAAGEPVAISDVQAVCAALSEEHGFSDAECSSPLRVPSRDAAPEVDDWFAAALTSTGQLAALIRALASTPLRLNRTGKPQTAAVRSCAARIGVSEERAFDLFEIGRTATTGDGAPILVPSDARSLHPGPGSAAWLAADHRDRWLALAEAAAAAPPALTTALERVGGSDVAAALDALPRVIPFSTAATREAAERTARIWDMLGVTVSGWLSRPGAAIVAGDPDRAALLAVLPDPAPGVYLQPDLTVIVPGPLTATDDAALAACTIPEQIGVASTLRVTEASLVHAFEQGADEGELRDLFDRLSLTGIPQPLDYLLTTVAEQVRSIIVSSHDGDEGRSRVEVRKPGLADMLRIDRALEHLHLQGDVAPGGVGILTSRLRPEHVLHALTQARYAALSGDDPASSDATPVPARSAPATGDGIPGGGALAERAAAAENPPAPAAGDAAEAAEPDPRSELADRVLAASAQGDGLGDAIGQISLACKERIPLELRVEVRGQVRDFVLTPLSLSAGRVRGLDQQAGVERTLPIDAITAIRPVLPDADPGDGRSLGDQQ